MRILNRKLARDLWRIRLQALAIALVVASGVGLLIMSLTSVDALERTANAFYERYRFAQVFATVKRAPEQLAGRIAHIPGVQTVETRIVEFATLDVAGFAEPVIGRLVSIPERAPPLLNRLALRAGREVAPGRPDEVVLSEPFAEAHGLEPGDHMGAILNGHRRTLEVVGIALSPEYVYAIAPGGLMPNNQRYGILWMGREALAAAFDLDGAFNDVALSLQRGAKADAVIERLDGLLARYGGTGAYGRADQVSNWYLTNEIQQQRHMSSILPTIFLAVAAVLANMVLARLVAVEREEIGLLKAFGYDNLAIGWHYAKLVLAIAGLGIGLGWLLGAWLGRVNTEIYAEFYRFPFLFYRPSAGVFVLAGLISLAATLLGSLSAVRRAAMLPPAEAMRPPAPPMYRRGGLGAAGLARWLDQPTRMIVRQIFRWPVRSFLTTAAMGMAVAVLVISMQWIDAIEQMVDVDFRQAQRQDMTVSLAETQSSEVVRDFAALPGVLAAEPMRGVSVRLVHGHRTHRGAIQGVPPDAHLNLVKDAGGAVLRIPPEGLVLSTALAEKLAVAPGEQVTVDVLEGRRPVRSVPVVGLFETYIGTPAYMHMAALNRLMRERPAVNAVHLLADEAHRDTLFAELKDLPDVSAVMVVKAAIRTFHETLAETIMIYVSFFVAFSCTLTFGVVYNSARIALSERARELGTLRVLGFTRFEISYILLGELALLMIASLPVGCLAGYVLGWAITSSMDTELYRVPLVIETSTYGVAMLIGLAAAAASAALVRRRLDHLDLIAVLKTRE